MRKEDEIEDSTKRLEMIVRGMVKKQALDIIKKRRKSITTIQYILSWKM